MWLSIGSRCPEANAFTRGIVPGDRGGEAQIPPSGMALWLESDKDKQAGRQANSQRGRQVGRQVDENKD